MWDEKRQTAHLVCVKDSCPIRGRVYRHYRLFEVGGGRCWNNGPKNSSVGSWIMEKSNAPRAELLDLLLAC